MRRERPIRSGALTVLAAGFVLSALLRAGEVVAGLPAIRDDGFGNRVAPLPDPAGDAGSGAAGEGPRSAPAGGVWPPGGAAPERETGALAAELQRQAARLNARQSDLDTRAQALEEAEARLRARLDELEALRGALEARVAGTRGAAAADVRRLADVYETMKPKQAGRIFDEMEPSFAAGFLGELGPEQAASILASMNPERAYAVSLLLAGRNLRGETAAQAAPAGE